MDPAQLVQMALNLSESRKRHVSSSLPVPVTPVGGRRVVSALDSGYGTVKSSSSGGKRASHVSDATPGSTRESRHGPDDNERTSGADNVVYTFTPATLSRAERARKYFELASEHRRLLEHLPPLKSDSTAPENYTLQATSSPGSAHYDMNRVHSETSHKRQLGRTYNPLQALRNRRLRNRERRPLTAPPDTWQETDRIKRWIDGVEATSNDPSYRPGEDRVRLPTFSGELEGEVESPEKAKRHRRSDTVNSVITRPDNGWSIEPAELLADTYWVEKGDNKSVIEDRHGNRIFPGRSRLSVDMPRASKEFEHGDQDDADQRSYHDESEDDDKVRSRRRNLLPIPGRLRRNYISRSPSTASNSSDEGRKPPAPRFGDAEGGDENIGPLDRHMRRMIAKEEKGELMSPELVSPDHWDHKHDQFQHQRGSIDRVRDSHQTAQGRLSVDSRGHRRSKSAEGRVSVADHGTSSTRNAIPDSPSSPVVAGFVPTVVRSPSHNKRSSPTEQKPKRSHIPIFRSKSKDRNNIERTDFAAEHIGKPLSPVLSADTTTEQPRSSFESGRPPPVQRYQTTDSNASSLRRINTATTATDISLKDSNASLPRRLLKGGRIGELMRTESSRLGDRFRGSRDRIADPALISDVSGAPSEISEDDTEQVGNKRARGEDTPDTDSQVSPRASYEKLRPKPKYYISNLPSFKSPAGGRNRSSTIETPMSEASDPFAKHDNKQSQHGGARPNLAPPKINLPDDELASDTEMQNGQGPLRAAEYDSRKVVSHNNISFAPSTEIQSRKRGAYAVGSRSVHDGKRHWSISDQAPAPPASRVTSRDVARVRALLLASGIKAQEIYTKANTGRETPLPVIAKAFETAGKPLQAISKKEEHLVASRVLSETLDTTLLNLDKALQGFQVETAKSLGDQLDDLSHRASEQLAKIVNETSDEADAFNVELTTKQPQEVKRVDEAVDAMFRQRRKQFRLLRRAGFKLLEWLVLGIMWWVWFVVVLINTFRRVIVGILLVLRWLLWF